MEFVDFQDSGLVDALQYEVDALHVAKFRVPKLPNTTVERDFVGTD